MNIYYMEFLMKERQQKIEEEFKHIHLSRIESNPGIGFFKEFIQEFGKVLVAMGNRLQKRSRPSFESELIVEDCC